MAPSPAAGASCATVTRVVCHAHGRRLSSARARTLAWLAVCAVSVMAWPASGQPAEARRSFSHPDVPIDIEIVRGQPPEPPFKMVLTNRGRRPIVAFSLASFVPTQPDRPQHTMDMRDVPGFGPGQTFVLPLPGPYDPSLMDFGTVYAVFDDGTAVGDFDAIEKMRAFNRLRLAQLREIEQLLVELGPAPSSAGVQALLLRLQERRDQTLAQALGVTADAWSPLIKGLATLLDGGARAPELLATGVREHLQHVRDEIAHDERTGVLR